MNRPPPFRQRLVRQAQAYPVPMPHSTTRSIPVTFATGERLAQHKAFFAATAIGEVRAGDVPPQGARWAVAEEWDARHTTRTGEKRGDPLLIEWRPDGRVLATAGDAFRITRWYADGRRISATTRPAHGHPNRLFWSRDGQLVLLQSRTGDEFWLVQDESGEIVRMVHGAWEAYWGMETVGSEFHRNGSFNPWRPGHRHLLIRRGGGPLLELMDIDDLPRPLPSSIADLPTIPRVGWLFGLALFLWFAVAWHLLRMKPKELANIRRLVSLNFAPLGAGDSSIMRYAWHPSGQYVAVTTGDSDDRSTFRVHVLHYDTGEIVASVPPTTTLLGWSQGGQSLLCQRGAGDLVVWDSHAWAVREVTEDERSHAWIRKHALPGTSFNNDGTLAAHQTPSGLAIRKTMREGEEEVVPGTVGVRHIAWSPTDPACFATTGGEATPHSVRIWRLMSSA